ncbi:MAG TPA: adenosylcobinamide-GDP ribazoletransferase [Methanocella sp.]|nr:adenosylcobinamide-GDP ribazoletransferase [Methanocella sp.]
MGGVHLAGALIKGLRAAIGFLTTIPVRIEEGDYESFISRIYLFVVVAIGVGVLAGGAGLVFQRLLPAPFAAALTLGGIFALTGINHVDGLSDTADGLVTSGPKERKIASMKDVHAGAGGILAIGLDLLFLFALLLAFVGDGLPVVYPLFVAEVGAKVATITVIAYGKSMGPGMGASAIAAARKSHFAAGVAIAWAAIVVATVLAITSYHGYPAGRLAMAGIGAMLTPLVAAALVKGAAESNFGGVNGDVMGAANEIGRIAVLAVTGVLLWTHF